MQRHFISDLHLDENRPGIEAILLRYLLTQAREAAELYLLGDIFEYWLGDDVSLDNYRQVIDALRRLQEAGTQLFFMRGNRDFLVGEAFSQATGCTLLDDPHVISHAQYRVLLSHGDLFCTEDTEHQKFRELVAQPAVRNRLLSLPAEQRETMARQIRGMSKSGNSYKPEDIMDVSMSTVNQVMDEFRVDSLIHGHTHRCAHHRYGHQGRERQRIVLSDWHEHQGSVLIAHDDGHYAFKDLN